MNFVFDIDGTICFDGKHIHPKIRKSIENLEETGHQVCFASARPPRDMLPVLGDRFKENLLIGANGAITYHNGELTHFEEMTNDLTNELVEILNDYNASYLIDGVWNYSYTGDESHPVLSYIDSGRLAERVELSELGTIVKFYVVKSDHPQELYKRVEQLDVTLHYHTSESTLDITAQNVNKSTGIRKGNLTEYICFGNDLNDIPMFEEASQSIMIGNNSRLGTLANEMIKVDELIEEKVASKIDELGVLQKKGLYK